MKQSDFTRYARCTEHWDSVFKSGSDRVPTVPDAGNAGLNAALRWICEGAKSVLDFGCGNGSLLFDCALLGTKRHAGIDLSERAVETASRRSRRMPVGEYTFTQGGAEALLPFSDESFDVVILSNILDNLYPDDAETVIRQCARILKPGGRTLVKLNPFLAPEQIEQWHITVIEGDLLDDGLLLWNLTTERWRELLLKYFAVERYEEIYYAEYEQTNRMFLLAKVK